MIEDIPVPEMPELGSVVDDGSATYAFGPVLMVLDNPEDGMVLIDSDLFSVLGSFRWGRNRKPNGDLIGMGNVYSLDGKRVHLGRWIAQAPKGWFVEYLNGNGLDCRRVNLRPVKNSGQATWRWREEYQKEQEVAERERGASARVRQGPFWINANGRWER